jgi:Protein of unknown function (DUF1569)
MYEPNLLQQSPYERLLERLNRLEPSSTALWGKMDVAQMLAHTAKVLAEATSREPTKQEFMCVILGPLFKRSTLTKGFSKNTPSTANVIATSSCDFETEKSNLIHALEHFFQGQEAGITNQPHTFFGRMSANEWARLQWLHLDHHLKQFGV